MGNVIKFIIGRIDLINKLKFYDPKVYEMDFKITNPNDLP